MRHNKYNAKRIVTEDGLKFDSKREYDYYLNLLDLEKSGDITNLRRQVKYILIPKNDKFRELAYVADFVYIDKDNIEHIVDVKGMILPEFKIKQKLFYSIFGKMIEIVK